MSFLVVLPPANSGVFPARVVVLPLWLWVVLWLEWPLGGGSAIVVAFGPLGASSCCGEPTLAFFDFPPWWCVCTAGGCCWAWWCLAGQSLVVN